MPRLSAIVLVLLICAGCAAKAAPTAQPAGQLAERPTIAPATPAQATAANSSASPPASDPDPATIVFQQPGDGSLRGITTSGASRELAEPTEPFQRLPWSASPDGRSIAVLVIAGGGPKAIGLAKADLWVAGIDESNPRQLLALVGPDAGLDAIEASTRTSALVNPQFQRLLWTLDGREIVVTSAHEGQVDLYAVASDGSAVRRLTNSPEVEFYAALSPDGRSIAYATASSFGTGAGWADPTAWVQPLDGAPQPLIDDSAGAAVELPGWLNNTTALAILHGEGGATSSVWAHEGGAAPRELYAAPNSLVWGLTPGQFAVIQSSADDPSAAGETLIWRGDTEALVPLEHGAASEVHLSPNLDLMLLCAGAGLPELKLALWNAGQRYEIGPGQCSDVVWSASGKLALGSGENAPSAAGIVVAPDGGFAQSTLLPGAIVAGWLGDALYFFAPTTGNIWQLYRFDTASGGAAQPVGQPIAERPVAPRLVAAQP